MAGCVWCIVMLYSITSIYAQTQCFREGGIRVVRIGSSDGAGRVEVCHNGMWGTICERSEAWSEKNALVACIHAGYSNGAKNSILHRTTLFADQADSSVPIHYSSVSCLGSETRITQCQLSNVTSGCDHSDDAGVLCWTVPSSHGDIRLIGDRDTGEGLVEFYDQFDGWVPVCPDSSWTSDVADIACRQLGYSSGVAAIYRLVSFISPFSLRQTGFNCPSPASDAFGLGECFSFSAPPSFCSSPDYAGVVCTSPPGASDGVVRLIGGSFPSEGRVEVYYNGRWGAVCETGWDSTDAEVVCEQLGFGGGSVDAFPTTIYPGGSNAKPVWLTNIDCESSDTEISFCDFDLPIGGEPCSSLSGGSQVNCDTGRIQTQCTSEGCLRVVRVGSRNGAGRVEVYHNGEWGTICERSEAWSEKNALVACILVGYSNGAKNPILHRTTLLADQADSSVPIHYSSVSCLGSETRITRCQFSTNVFGCDHSDDAGVLCWTDTPSQADIRLVGIRGNGTGLVEFYDQSDGWTPICTDSSWTSDVADIACHQLGYSTGTATTYRFVSPISNSFQRRTIFDCPTPTSDVFGLVECSSFRNPLCSSTDYAGVVCTSTPGASDGVVRLVGGSSPSEGRVEVYYNGRWGAVCETGWDSTDADVVCEQLGFGGGSANAFPTTIYRGDSNAKPVWLTNVSCNSSDTEISSCDFDLPIGGEPCSSVTSNEGAQVDCVTRTQCTSEGCLRLVRIGSSNGAGRVEVYHNGEWGTICERSEAWSEKNALVACILVGYSNGAKNPILHRTTLLADQVDSRVPIHYSSVSCLGSETRITRCQLSINVSGCDHSDDAGVLCWTDTPSQADIRLVGDTDSGEGLVEFYDTFNGWIPVCPDSWTSDVADIACRQLGYSTGSATIFLVSFISPFSLRQMGFNCPSPASDAFGLGECSSFSATFCSSTDYAGVVCTSAPDASDGDVRLIGGSSPSEGRVEVYYNGRWGAVCETGWNSTDADVVCEQLGFVNGSVDAFPITIYPGGSNAKPVWLTNISCESSDTEISFCDFALPIGGEPCSSVTSNEGAQVDCGLSSEPSEASPAPSGGLSPGGIAGIIIAVFVVVSVVVLLVGKNWWKKRHQYLWYNRMTHHWQTITSSWSPNRNTTTVTVAELEPSSAPTITQQQQSSSESPADEDHETPQSSRAQAEATPANPNAEFTKQPPPAYHAAVNFPTADQTAVAEPEKPTDIPPPYPGPPVNPYSPAAYPPNATAYPPNAAAYSPNAAVYPPSTAVHTYPPTPYPLSTGPAYPPPLPNYQGYPPTTNPAYPPTLDPAYPPSVAPYPDTLQQGAPPPPPPGELPYPSVPPPGSPSAPPPGSESS